MTDILNFLGDWWWLIAVSIPVLWIACCTFYAVFFYRNLEHSFDFPISAGAVIYTTVSVIILAFICLCSIIGVNVAIGRCIN